MYSQGKFGRAGGRGQGRMVAPSQAEAAAATPIAPRSRPGILPAPKNSNGNGNRKVKGAGAAAPVAPAVQNGTEEVFSLLPRHAQPFAMLLKLPPGLGLVEEVKRAEAEGANVQIKFGPLSHNVSGNVIDVGGKEFRFTWAPEPGELCDIYEERQSGEDGNGVLVESGAAWRKLNVQPTLNESARDRVKMSSAEAERQQKSRKAIILDHGNPLVKNQPKPVTVASNDSNTRKLLVKTKKEPPPKKRKIEGSSAALGSDAVAKPVVSQPIHSSAPKSATSPVVPQSEHPITLPQPTSMQGTSGTHFSKGHANTDGVVNRRHSSKGDVGKQKDKISNLVSMPVSEGGNQKSGVSSTPTDLRNLLITQLTENPKGMSIKSIEKAIGVSGKKIEPMIKTIATYLAPGRYFLKPGVEKESSMKLSSGSGSSPECQPNESPFVDSSPLSEKAGEPTDEQQVHSTPTQDSDLNIVDEIDDHLHESLDAPANQKNTINSDGSSSSSSSDSGSDSESDTGSSDSGSESGSSSDTESEVSSSSSEESDEVDIMGEEETEQKLRDSKATSSHVGRDGSGESFEQKCMIEDIRNVSPRNSEEVDICDDMGDGEGISDIAKHYVEKITSDGEDDVDMAVDIEGETKTPEAKIIISPKHGKQEDNHSPIAIGVSLQETKDKRNEVKENQIEETAQKSEKMPKSIYKHGYDKNQAQTGYDKYRSKQENKTRIEKKEGVDAETKRSRDVSSQSRFESPARHELSPSKKDFETRQFPKEINKSRFTDTNLERASEQATPLGRSRVPSTAEAQIGPTKDLDFERFDPHTDGQQSHQRSSEADSRAKVTDVVQRPGRYADHKISKSHDRALRQVTESDISAPKSSNIEEKNSRHEINFRTASEEDAVAKEKSNNSLRNSKENEYTERHSRTSELQGKRGGDQNGWHSRDVGTSGQLFMRNTPKDTKKPDIDKHHFPSGKESVLKREYSDLELGEFREPLSEEEPQESKTRFEKLQVGRHSAEAKAKNGSKRESASPDMAKGCLSGKAASELRKVSPSEPLEDINKHNGWIGKRMSEDGMQDLMRPKKSRQSPFPDHTDLQDLMRPKKSRQSPFTDHTDMDPSTIQEKMTDMAVKATTNETMKTSPRRGMETQPGAAYRSTSTNGLQKPEYKARVQEVIAGESKNNLQNIKGNAKSDEKRKENSRRENNLIPVRKKFGTSDEGNPFYAKYEKDKPELRGQIRNLSQYKEYISEFQEKYECYQQLNTALESDMKDFQKLGRDLQSAEDRGDTKSCANISEQVKEAFSQCIRRHKRMKKVFVLLHEELKILKQRITEFAARYTPQK